MRSYELRPDAGQRCPGCSEGAREVVAKDASAPAATIPGALAVADHNTINKVEWFGGLWFQKSAPCIPAEVQMACIIGGAKVLSRGLQAAADASLSPHTHLRALRYRL